MYSLDCLSQSRYSDLLMVVKRQSSTEIFQVARWDLEDSFAILEKPRLMGRWQ